MYTLKNTAGYSFVEVLVSITILLVSIVGPLTIASTGLRNAQFAREQNIAFFLAQEGLEEIVFLRENAGIQNVDNGTDTWDWVTKLPADCFSGNPCRVNIDDSSIEPNDRVTECDPVSECDLYLHSTGAVRYNHDSNGEETPFNRQLFFSQSTGSETLYVTSIVEWNASAFGATREVVLEMVLYDIYGN